jgi:hypothetical protein
MMDEGAVLLVDLSPSERLHHEDARLFGTLLLTDFFAQMFKRKRTDKGFYLYIDEFQEYATSEIARLLDQCRKFGLRLCLAHQRPGQLENSDNQADRDIYSAVMTNARNKAVFGGIGPQELEPIARLLMLGTYDPLKIKNELWTKSIVEYQKEYWQAHSRGTSSTTTSSFGGSSGRGSMSASGSAVASGATFDPNTGIFGPQRLFTSESNSWSNAYGSSDFSGESWSEGYADTESESITEFPVLVPVLGEQLSTIYYETPEEQLLQCMAVLYDQQQRQAMVKIQEQKEPIPIETPFIKTPPATDTQRQRTKQLGYDRAAWFLKTDEATKLIDDARRNFLALGELVHREPEQPRATIDVESSMPQSPTSIAPVKLNGLQLTDRDFGILRDVFENRFISIKHAAALHWPDMKAGEAAAKRRLAKFAEAGLLKRQDVDVEGYKVIYRLTKAAVELLAEYKLISTIIGDQWDDKMRKRFTKTLASSHLTHELKLYDLKIALERAIEDRPDLHCAEFGIWPWPYKFDVIFKGKKSGQKPDGFLHLVQHPSPDQKPFDHYFFIEFDHRGSEQLDILVEKVQKYKLHLENGFAQRIGKKDAPISERSFRVLFVVETADSAQRRDNILAKLAAAKIGTIAHVATFDDLKTDPLGAVWSTPKDWDEWIAEQKASPIAQRSLM